MTYQGYALMMQLAGPFVLLDDFHETYLQHVTPLSGSLDMPTRKRPVRLPHDGLLRTVL